MLSNLINQLKEQGASDKYQEVLAEVPRVRKDLGYPPLVTPTSQIVGTQAVLNVVTGERYKMVTKETKGVLKGEYGKLPAEPNPDVVKKCIGDEPRITCRPADLLQPEYEKYKSEMQKYYTKEEDVLSYCMFPQVSEKFFKWREERHKRKFNVTVNGKTYEVEVKDDDYIKPEVTETKKASVATQAPVVKEEKKETPVKSANGSGEPVKAPMPGSVLAVKVSDGAKVKSGDVLILLEAMKMENEIVADRSGTVTLNVKTGDKIDSGDIIAYIS